MEGKLDVTLNNFYIFNPIFGAKEGEEEKKVLFYYPSKGDVINQIKNVGLSEAIIKFTQNFNSNGENKSVHTLRTRQFMYQPEKSYWIVMTINVPFTKSKNGLEDIIYHYENIHDDVYFSILKQAYEMYKLFMGTFESFLQNDQNNIIYLKENLNKFFTRYLQYLKISNCDIIDVFEGMQFLPLDKKTYLHVQTLTNFFQCEFGEQVQFSAFLVKQYLVWSDIEAKDMRVIYRYLITNLLAPYITDDSSKETNSENVLLSENKAPSNISSKKDVNLGSFILCPSFYSRGKIGIMRKVPKIFIRCGDKNLAYQLLVFNVLSSFICLFIPETIQLTSVLLKNIETFLRKNMVAVASELLLHIEKKRVGKINISSNGNPFSYICFNHLNLAQKNTLYNKTPLSPDVSSVLVDLCFDKKRNCSIGETILKMYDDHWIIAQFCNEREFYVVTQQKNSTLIEINEEMKKICDKQLKSIFFHV